MIWEGISRIDRRHCISPYPVFGYSLEVCRVVKLYVIVPESIKRNEHNVLLGIFISVSAKG